MYEVWFVLFLPAASVWPPHIVCQAACCALCNRIYYVYYYTPGHNTLCSVTYRSNMCPPLQEMCPLCPLFISLGVAVRLKADRRWDRRGHRRGHRQTRYPGLTGSERVVHRAGDPSLPGEQAPAQAHVVRGVSDAELGQQQLPARPLHLRLSASLRPSAGWGGGGSPGDG